MQNKKVLIFGGTGGIGTATTEQCRNLGATVVSLGKTDIDLTSPNLYDWFVKSVSNLEPDVVIHCAGVVGSDNEDYSKIFDINFASAWVVIKNYLHNQVNKTVNLVFVGSSACNRPSPKYILYAASKAALVSMIKSAAVALPPNIYANIINPSKTNTRLRQGTVGKEPLNTLLCPKEVAEAIVRLAKTQQTGTVIELEKNGQT